MTDPNSKNRGAAFVAGGSGGLGSAICRLLAREWQAVHFTYHSNRESAENLQKDIAAGSGVASYSAMDITDSSSIRKALDEGVSRYGTLGTVVFASGAHIEQPFVSQINTDQWQSVIEIELMGFTRLVQEVIPLFRRQDGGNLVSVVSFAAYHFPPGDALSAVPKAGIEVLCRAIAKEEGRYGIRANSVAPGIINTGLGGEFQKTLFTPEIWEGQRKRVPLKRFGEGDEIAEAVAFLASGRSSYITGQTIIVDGGMCL